MVVRGVLRVLFVFASVASRFFLDVRRLCFCMCCKGLKGCSSHFDCFLQVLFGLLKFVVLLWRACCNSFKDSDACC